MDQDERRLVDGSSHTPPALNVVHGLAGDAERRWTYRRSHTTSGQTLQPAMATRQPPARQGLFLDAV